MKKNVNIVLFIFFFLLTSWIAIGGESQTQCTRKIVLSGNDLGSWSNPIKCEGVKGEREYLSRLMDSSGKPVQFRRIGHIRPDPKGHVLDKYEIRSSDGSTCAEIYMDMYWPGYIEMQAVKGFIIINQGKEDTTNVPSNKQRQRFETRPLTAKDVYLMIMNYGFYCEIISGSQFHDQGLKDISKPKDLIFFSGRIVTTVIDKENLIRTKSMKMNGTKKDQQIIELQWLPKSNQCTFAQAIAAIEKLNKNNTDKNKKWRIPTILELFSIVEQKTHNHFPAVFKFPKNQSLTFWTSTPVKKQGTVLEYDKKNKAYFVIRNRYNSTNDSYSLSFSFQDIEGKNQSNAVLLPVFSSKVYNYTSPKSTQPIKSDKPPQANKKPENNQQKSSPIVPKSSQPPPTSKSYPGDKIPGFDDYKGPPTKKTKKPPKTQKKANQQFPPDKIPGFDDVQAPIQPGKTIKKGAVPKPGKTIKQNAAPIPRSFKISLYPIFREGPLNNNKEKALKDLKEDIKKRVSLLGLKIKRNLNCQLVFDEKHPNIFGGSNITEIQKVYTIISDRYLSQGAKLSKMKDEIMSFQQIDILVVLYYIGCGKSDVHIFVPIIISGIGNEIYSYHFALEESQFNDLSQYIKDIIEKIICSKFSR